MFHSARPEYSTGIQDTQWGEIIKETSPFEREKILSLTKLVLNKQIIELDNNAKIDIGRNSQPNILVTGMPRLGKSTTLGKISYELDRMGVIHRLISERPPIYPKDFADEYGSLFYNLAFSLYGLAHLAANFHDAPLTFYDKGLVDQIVFTQALEKLYIEKYGCQAYGNIIADYYTWLKHFIPLIDGIIICNSSHQTSINNGCSLPEKFLEFLSHGFQKLPETISSIKDMPYPQTIVVNIDFDTEENPHNLLKKSIYTLIKWNVEGTIKR